MIGCSAGGLEALKTLLPELPKNYPAFVIIVQHVHPFANNFLAHSLDELSSLSVKLAEDQEALAPGVAYIAPPNYHLLIEQEQTLVLSVDERVNYSRPSIDVLFQTAAKVFQNQLVGVILTGANRDGSDGLKTIHHYGGLTIAQDPTTAEYPTMPQAAINTGIIDHVFALDKIASKLVELNRI